MSQSVGVVRLGHQPYSWSMDRSYFTWIKACGHVCKMIKEKVFIGKGDIVSVEDMSDSG